MNIKKRTRSSLPKETDFNDKQIDLFRSFICNKDEERNKLSNTLDLWDSVPRYSVSRQAMDKERRANGFLDLLEINFQYRGKQLQAIIQPARIREKDGTTKDYYPSANEELTEDALRKIATEQSNGFFNKSNYISGVVFTLHMLREELKKRGHTRSYQQIILSLNILSSSIIEIRASNGENGEGFAKSAYLPSLSSVSKAKIASDPSAKWAIQFHPLVTQSIDILTYRQFNYSQMMTHSTQLARWLHKQLSLKFTFASLTTTFDMRYSTIKRDSALLESYKQQRQAIKAIDLAFQELKEANILTLIRKNKICNSNSKIEDVIYTLTASIDFISQMKAANKRDTLNKTSLKS